MNSEEQWELVNTVLLARQNVLLYGPPGRSKSFCGRRLPNSIPVTLTEQADASTLLGSWCLEPDQVSRQPVMSWRDGPGIAAWRDGALLVLDEVQRLQGDGIGALLALTDCRESAKIRLANGEIVKPSAGFHVLATMNGEPSELDEALLSRFSIRFNIKQVPDEAWATLPEPLATHAKNIGGDFRPWRAMSDCLKAGLSLEVAAQAVLRDSAQDFLNAVKIAS